MCHRLISMLLILSALTIPAARAQSAKWPSAPVRIVVAYPAGGPNDLIARAIGQQLTAAYQQPVIIENRPGASGTIGSEYVARATPDGYTLMLTATTHSMVNALYDKLSYDADKDFTAITKVGQSSLVLVVNPELPVRSVNELITLAKASPGKFAFASTGGGSTPHLAGEMFRLATNLDLIHVPYKGSAPAIVDLLGGQVQIMFETMPSAAPHIKSGKLRPIAVTTSTRSAEMPELPTISEAGLPGYEVSVWWGVVGPAKIPDTVAEQISQAVNKTLTTPEIRERFLKYSIEPVGTSPNQFQVALQNDIKKYAKIIKDGNIRAN